MWKPGRLRWRGAISSPRRYLFILSNNTFPNHLKQTIKNQPKFSSHTVQVADHVNSITSSDNEKMLHHTIETMELVFLGSVAFPSKLRSISSVVLNTGKIILILILPKFL